MAKLGFIVIAGLVACAAAQPDPLTYTDCRTADACMGDDNVAAGTTICRILQQVDEYESPTDPAKRKATGNKIQWGKCVQCMVDTDCKEGEWCAPELAISGKWWDADDMTKMLESDIDNAKKMFAAYSGGQFKLRSQCVAYGTYADEKEKIGSPCSSLQNSPSQDPQFPTSKATCTYVTSWQGSHYSCKSSGIDGATACSAADSDDLKNNNKNTPGACMAFVDNANPNGLPFPGGIGWCDNGIGWTGQCIDNKCQVCKNGATGPVKAGFQTICINNVWTDLALNDGTPRTLNQNVLAQLSVTIIFFLVWTWLIVCCTCLSVARAARNKGGSETTVQNPAAGI